MDYLFNPNATITFSEAERELARLRSQISRMYMQLDYELAGRSARGEDWVIRTKYALRMTHLEEQALAAKLGHQAWELKI